MKYLVGMSGGIDSSVAAVKLKKEGHEVIGVHMRLWSEDNCMNKCCNTADFKWAMEVANRFDIPFQALNVREVFQKRIVKDAFLNPYEQGRTPNPCVSCNRNIRFGAMLEKGLELGVDKVCTGHYARVEEKNGVYQLRRGVDPDKDQSYFLHRVTQEKLARMTFPLGEMTKKEVKALAEKWGIINQNRGKVESQDLCFIPEKTPEPFLRRHLSQELWREGDIVTAEGRVLGKHRGLPFYTIGQRRGLEIGGLEEPLYVTAKDSKSNHLVVGKREEGLNQEAAIRNLSVIPPEFDEKKTYDLRVRYHGKPVRGRIQRVGKPYSDDSGQLWNASVQFDEPLQSITPGQFVVVYEGEYCLGGGEIV